MDENSNHQPFTLLFFMCVGKYKIRHDAKNTQTTSNYVVNSETSLQKESKDDFQWATELGYLKGVLSAPPSVEHCAQQRYQLMIFSGLHTGASMPLANGVYSLGSSYECDIVLKEPGIEPIHLKVVCMVDTIAVRPENGAVYLDGQQIDCETVLPEPPVVVTISGIHFGLAVGNAAWYPLHFPEIAEDTRDSPEKYPEGQVCSSDDAQPAKTGTINNYFQTALNRVRNAGALSKFVPVVFILLFIVSGMFLFRAKAPDNAALTMDIEKHFTERHLPKPVIQVNAEGFLEITAYVPTVSQKEEIADFLQELPLAVLPHIYADDQVNHALQNYISRMSFLVEAAYQGNGQVLAKGFVRNQQEADVLQSLLKSNVAGLHTVELQVWQLDLVRPELTDILKETGLADKIDLRPQSGYLLAKGALNTEERASWQIAKKKIAQRLGRQINIVDRISNFAYTPGKIDIPIASVTMQPYSFITLQDGKVYFKGASLQSGTVIKDIGPERIVVEIKGQDYYYNL